MAENKRDTYIKPIPDIENIAYLSTDDHTCTKDTNAVSTENDGAYQCQPLQSVVDR